MSQHSEKTITLVCAGFPNDLRDDVLIALAAAGKASHEPFSDSTYQSKVETTIVTVPYRVYFPATAWNGIARLSARQKAIFAAIMTRHFDGYQREYWTPMLCANPTTWTAPYLGTLLGDYVIQVLAAARDNLTADWLPTMKHYATQNELVLPSLNHRILNYWTIYYRYSGRSLRLLTDYPGYALAEKLGLWDRRTAPKLLRKAKAARGAS